jgi:polysaccharide biosynthesis protein PslH
MRVLIITGRFPQTDGKGDQQRALQLAQLLAPHHDVTVLAPAPAPAPLPAQRSELETVAALHLIATGPARRLAGALGAGARGLPLQVGWMMPAGTAREVAAAAAHADVVIAVTIRCLRERLPAPTVLDHIDALSLNMRERARLEPRAPLRAAALVEASLLRRHERRAARWVAAQTVVSALDAAALPSPPQPVVLPLVLELGPGERDRDRDIDVIMTGDMRYPPNRDGARWLAAEIVPALHRRAGDVRVVVAGRAARTLREMAGVEMLSDVDDIGQLLRRSRVAVVPLRRGTGTPIKLLEAAAAGAAPVSTPWVATALGVDVDTAGDATAFAAAIDRLLADEPLRLRRVQAARDGLARHAPAAVSGQLLALLEHVRAA